MDAITDVLFAAPPACFTCNARILGQKMLRYLFEKYSVQADPGATLTTLGIVRPCCRRTYMSAPCDQVFNPDGRLALRFHFRAQHYDALFVSLP
jgi:DNA-directed RNA polymerase subunit N (RpoN/RPB10)